MKLPLFAQLLPQTPSTQPTSREALIAQLQDVITPEPVSWWPPAIGWWLLALIIITVLFSAIIIFRKMRKKNAYRRASFKLLNSIDPDASLNEQEYAKQVTSLLKRCFFAACPNEKTAASKSFGDHWHQLLESTLGGKKFPIDIAWGTLLYGKDVKNVSKNDIKTYAAFWIKHHKGLSNTNRKPTDQASLQSTQGAQDVPV